MSKLTRQGKAGRSPETASQADAAVIDMIMERAVRCYQGGELLQAKILYEAILASAPDNAPAKISLAVVEENTGNAEGAERLLRDVVEAGKGDATAYEFLGILTRRRGLFAEASRFLEKAATLRPGSGVLWARAGETAQTSGEVDRARELYEKALAVDPGNELALINLGNIRRDAGERDEAERLFRHALTVNPEQVMALNNLGQLCNGSGRTDEAREHWEAALRLAPNDADVLYNLGNLAGDRGEKDEAERFYRRALEADPGHVSTYVNLGNLLRGAGRLDEADACYRRGLTVDPDSRDLLVNLSACCVQLRRTDEALRVFDRLEALGDNSPFRYYNQALARSIAGLTAEGMEGYLRAIHVQADLPWPDGGVRAVVNSCGEMADWFRDRLDTLPPEKLYTPACAALGAAFARMGSYRECFFLIDLAHRYPGTPEKADAQLFIANYSPEFTADEVFAVYRAYYADHQQIQAPAIVRSERSDSDRPLRIGYVSPDFRSHSCSFFIEPLFEAHDKRRVEIFAYAEQRNGDEITARVRAHTAGWCETLGMPDERMVDQIRADGIDILVDLAGHTMNNRIEAMTRRAAPVQATWMGYCYTTGAPNIDYYIGDEISSPVGCEHLFSEQIARLPFFLACYRPPESAGAVRSSPALDRGYVTFGSLTRSVRVNPHVIDVWSEILHAVPNARLVLNSKNYTDSIVRDVTLARFQRNGIADERLEVVFTQGPWNIYGGIAITLDCFTHNSGTTLSESLWAGVPFVTLADRPSVGRLGASILDTVGHPEWIAWNEREYVRKAVQLATDIPRLEAIRARLRDEVKASPLVDAPRFARAMELTYRRMWRRYTEGLPPGPIRVEAHEV